MVCVQSKSMFTRPYSLLFYPFKFLWAIALTLNIYIYAKNRGNGWLDFQLFLFRLTEALITIFQYLRFISE
jgi:hypothetical protein